MSTYNGKKVTGTVTKLPCGCVHDERRWIEQCEPHLLDWYNRHQLAQVERRATVGEQEAVRQAVLAGLA